jgi:hypothetical protein
MVPKRRKLGCYPDRCLCSIEARRHYRRYSEVGRRSESRGLVPLGSQWDSRALHFPPSDKPVGLFFVGIRGILLTQGLQGQQKGGVEFWTKKGLRYKKKRLHIHQEKPSNSLPSLNSQ